MTKASEKYRNWFESDLLVADLMNQAADDIDERDAEIERLREALKPFVAPCLEHCHDHCESDTEPMEQCICFQASSALQQKESA